MKSGRICPSLSFCKNFCVFFSAKKQTHVIRTDEKSWLSDIRTRVGDYYPDSRNELNPIADWESTIVDGRLLVVFILTIKRTSTTVVLSSL